MLHILNAKSARLSKVPEDPKAVAKRVDRFLTNSQSLDFLMDVDYVGIAMLVNSDRIKECS
jgi:hypothetical protein